MTAGALNPIGDTTLRLGAQYTNYGTDTTLGVTSVSTADIKRTVLKFNQTQIAAAIPAGNVLYAARLNLQQTGISAGWLGGGLDVFRMTRTWEEGTGLSGHGASWVCADDSNTTATGNLTNNCTSANNWSMTSAGPYAQPYVTTATDRVPLFTNGLSTVTFDVTPDVQAYLNGSATNFGWMIGAAPSPLGGQFVNFGSRESSSKPTLSIDYGPDQCPADPNKGLPGSCGCGVPDLDVNLDNVPDCFAATTVDTGDTTLNFAQPFANDGADTILGVTSASVVSLQRSLIKIDSNAINAARQGRTIKHAYLELTLAGISAGWAGGQVGAFRMTKPWAEGNTTGHGASWTCADDTNTSTLGNLFNNCASTNNWSMPVLGNNGGPYVSTASALASITFPGATTVRLDVTADITTWSNDPGGLTNPNYGWILQGVPSNFLSGSWVNFGSRESGAPPRLLLDLDLACPAGTDGDADHDGVRDCKDLCMDDASKSAPGQCGCGNADTDTDGDQIPNCIDPCPADADPSLGGECGCPSGPTALAPLGTQCTSVCGGPNGDGVDVCNGAGHCGTSTASCGPVNGCACVPMRTTHNIYWYCPCAQNATTARAACEAVAGESLAEIDTAADNAFIRSRISADTWIAANDQATEGAWRWSTNNIGAQFWQGNASGKPYYGRYNNWASGQPSDASGTLDCAAMSAAGTSGQWVAHSCTDNLNVLCVRSVDDVPNLRNVPKVPPRTCDLLGNCIPAGVDNDATCISPQAVPGACPAGDDNAQCPAQQQANNDLHACDDCLKDPANKDVCDPTSSGANEAACQGRCSSACTAASAMAPPGSTCRDTQDSFQGEIHCALTTATNQACQTHADCAGQPANARHCGRTFYCYDGVTRGASCALASDAPSTSTTDLCPNAANDECVSFMVCGDPTPDCAIGDNDTDPCVEYDSCLAPENDITSIPPDADTITDLEEPDVLQPDQVFKAPTEPTTNTTQFPEDGPCADGTSNCTPGGKGSHAWCSYQVDGQLPPRDAPYDKSVTAGPNSQLSFSFDPKFGLHYSMTNGPLGLPMPLVSADASLTAGTFVQLFGVKRTLDIIDIGLSARAGLQAKLRPGFGPTFDPTADLCGFKSDSHAKILGIDILPGGDAGNASYPPDATQQTCVEAVQSITEGIDRLRKALEDARELVRQYTTLKAAGKFLSDGSNVNIPSLCMQLASDPPHNFPPVATGYTCKNEPPEMTINRFITYYNTVVIADLRNRADTLASKLDGWNQDPRTLAGIDKQEEITIFNETFMIGPVPVNLEVLMPVSYGFDLTVTPTFAVGQLLKQMVFGADSKDAMPFAKLDVNGTPHAGAGISLFAGVGFDLGFAAAKIGIEGAVDLGSVHVPMGASAGLTVGMEHDDRPLPSSITSLVGVNQQVLIPSQKVKFGLVYGINGRLQLDNILDGELDARLKLKFFWFSVNYHKRIVRFHGFCSSTDMSKRQHWCTVTLFESGPSKTWDWGTIQMPLVFTQLPTLPVITPPPNTQLLPASLDRVVQPFYDGFCACIPDGAPAPKGLCFRSEDCCESDSACQQRPGIPIEQGGVCGPIVM